MIIYKIQESGEATDFQFSQTCPDGWLSIPSDVIPVDITPFHATGYLKKVEIVKQRSLCKRYLDNSDKVFCSDWSYPADVPTWETSRAEWKRIFRSNEIETVYPPPFGN